jgi:NAD(P)-dependent dehydrogenase (short-subunit alcohol dehydrogenase family)
MRGLTGKRILICGGATGIGAATALRLAEEGARVLIGDIDLDAAEATAKLLPSASAAWFDLASESSVNALVEQAVDVLGGIDGLYNVGADLSPDTLGRDANLLEMDPDVWRRTFEVNLLGYAHTCRTVIPLFLAQGGGVIVNTSSNAHFYGETVRPAYAATKAGVNALTRHIASTWGRKGIRCNGVSPGLVLSEKALEGTTEQFQTSILNRIHSTRLGEPGDVANTVAFLLSDESAWVNGQTWAVNGGGAFRE